MIGDIWAAQTNFGKHTKRSNMIKNLIVFLSLSGLMVMIYKLMNHGLGKRWDELGLIIFVLITMLIIISKDD